MLELNRLYKLDCMEGMKEFPDEYFDLAIVDPPYGVGSVTYMPRTRSKAAGGYIDRYEITVATLDIKQRNIVKTSVFHHNNTKHTVTGRFEIDQNTAPAPEYFEELFRVSKNQIIWGGNHYILPPSRGFVIWRKTTVSESFSMGMCEYAWLSFNTNPKVFDAAPQGTVTDARIHPTQKPVKLYTWLLKNFAKPGDKIIDTHVGSASSLIACYDMDFDFVGFEIDEDYHAAAQSRLDFHMAQMKMEGI